MPNWWTETSNTVKAVVAIIGIGFSAGLAYQALASDVDHLKEQAVEEREVNKAQTATAAEQGKVLDRLIMLRQMDAGLPIEIRPGVSIPQGDTD